MTVHTLASVLAGIAFDPNIRGILVVLVAVVVLIGGPCLILARIMGSRLVVLVCVAELSCWMVVF